MAQGWYILVQPRHAKRFAAASEMPEVFGRPQAQVPTLNALRAR